MSGILHAPSLRRTAAIMRNWSCVLDDVHRQTCCLQRTNCALTARSGSLDHNVDLRHALILSSLSDLLGGYLRCERRGLTRSLEAYVPAAGPRDYVAGLVADAQYRVVERRVYMRYTVIDVLLLAPLALSDLTCSLRQFCSPPLLLRRHLLVRNCPSRTFARTGISLGALASDRQAEPVTLSTIAPDID